MIFAANLKCFHTRASFKEYAKTLNSYLESFNEKIYVFAPSSCFLDEKLNFIQGTQNFYPCVNGAYTGEIGLSHLNEFKINTVLIAHSERRLLESDALLKAKFDFAVQHNLEIFFCIGEDLQTKEQNKTKEFLQDQLSKIDLSYEKLTIAYEPIYSIGTGKSASLKDIEEVLAFVKSIAKLKCLYGGSVSDKNIKELRALKDCDGVFNRLLCFRCFEFY